MAEEVSDKIVEAEERTERTVVDLAEKDVEMATDCAVEFGRKPAGMIALLDPKERTVEFTGFLPAKTFEIAVGDRIVDSASKLADDEEAVEIALDGRLSALIMSAALTNVRSGFKLQSNSSYLLRDPIYNCLQMCGWDHRKNPGIHHP